MIIQNKVIENHINFIDFIFRIVVEITLILFSNNQQLRIHPLKQTSKRISYICIDLPEGRHSKFIENRIAYIRHIKITSRQIQLPSFLRDCIRRLYHNCMYISKTLISLSWHKGEEGISAPFSGH